MAEAVVEMVAEAVAGTDRVDVAMSEHLPGNSVRDWPSSNASGN